MGGDVDVADWLQRASELRGSARDFLRLAPAAVRGLREVGMGWWMVDGDLGEIWVI